MLELQKEFTYKGFTYTQVKREGKYAIYKFTNPLWSYSPPKYYYDTIIIRDIPAFTYPNGKFQEQHEAYPNNEQFGKIAWCWMDLESAERKFKELIEVKQHEEKID